MLDHLHGQNGVIALSAAQQILGGAGQMGDLGAHLLGVETRDPDVLFPRRRCR